MWGDVARQRAAHGAWLVADGARDEVSATEVPNTSRSMGAWSSATVSQVVAAVGGHLWGTGKRLVRDRSSAKAGINTCDSDNCLEVRILRAPESACEVKKAPGSELVSSEVCELARLLATLAIRAAAPGQVVEADACASLSASRGPLTS